MSEFKSRWGERKEDKTLPANPFVSFVSSIPREIEKNKPLEQPRKKEKKEIPCPSGRARDTAEGKGSSGTKATSAEKPAHPTDTLPTKLTKGTKEILQTRIKPTDKTDKRSKAVEPVPDKRNYHPLQTEDPQTMPSDIQAAYDRGDSITFSKERGRWELYEVLEPPVVLSDEALKLMDMYHQGELPERVYNRLTKLFTENPHDLSERLEKAALFVKEKAE